MLSFEKFLQIIDRQEEANFLTAALDLYIFTLIDNNHLNAKQVARKGKMKLDGILPLLNALSAMGALRKNGERFSNTSETYKHLCESSKDFKKGTVMLRMSHRNEWDKLTQIVRYGRNLSEYEGPDDPEFRRLFSYAMHERSVKFTRKVAKVATQKPIGRLLDLGSGPGSYSLAILKKDKNAYATLIDRSASLKVAREIATSMKLMQRIHFIEGDLFETSFGSGYQTVLFSNILHIYNEGQNKRILKKIHNALEPSGRIIINDLFLKDNRLEPYDAALFSLTMLLYTARGKTYTFEETEYLLKEIGFYNLIRIPISEGSSLIVGSKK